MIAIYVSYHNLIIILIWKMCSKLRLDKQVKCYYLISIINIFIHLIIVDLYLVAPHQIILFKSRVLRGVICVKGRNESSPLKHKIASSRLYFLSYEASIWKLLLKRTSLILTEWSQVLNVCMWYLEFWCKCTKTVFDKYY